MVKLVSPDGAAGNNFGASVSVDGPRVIVGAPRSAPGGLVDAGEAWTFVRAAGTWSLDHDFAPSDGVAGDLFGTSVSISGERVVIGAPGRIYFGAPRGIAYAYSTETGSWVQEPIAFHWLPQEHFAGTSVVMRGRFMMIGVPMVPWSASTATATSMSHLAGSWVFNSHFYCGGAYDCGSTLDSDGWVWMAGGPHYGPRWELPNEGSVSVGRNLPPYGPFAEAMLTAPVRRENALFGCAVAVSGTVALITACGETPPSSPGPGLVYVYEDQGHATWTTTAQLTAPHPEPGVIFGRALAMNEIAAVVGSPDSEVDGKPGAGRLDLFVHRGGEWHYWGPLTEPVPGAGDAFGSVLQVQDRTIAIGAPGPSGGGASQAGAAYLETCPLDNLPPACNAGDEIHASCDGVPLDGTASDPEGQPLTISWQSSCPEASFFPGPDVLEPVVTFGSNCGVRCTLTLTATDPVGATCSHDVDVSVDDTIPPVVQPGTADVSCLWPPNHAMACFTEAAFRPVIVDNCTGPTTWRFVGCASDEPADVVGSGQTAPDCVLAADGLGFCARAERSGGGSGRRYWLTVTATDACGNTSAPTTLGAIVVPHDAAAVSPGCLGVN